MQLFRITSATITTLIDTNVDFNKMTNLGSDSGTDIVINGSGNMKLESSSQILAL